MVRDAIYLEDELVAVVDQQAIVGTTALPIVAAPLPPLSPRGWLLLLTGSAGLLLLLGGSTARRPRAAEAGLALLALAVTSGACGGPAVSIVWVHTDYLGKPLVVTNSPTDGSAPLKIWTATYEPYGLATPNTDPSGTGNHFTLDFRFPGQVFDAEMGMHCNTFRNYDASAGRYLESDPVRLLARIYDLGSGRWANLNPVLMATANSSPYPYTLDRPNDLIDPEGLKTLQLGLSVNLQVGPISLNGFGGVAADDAGDLSVYYGGGPGGGVGAKVSGGVSVEVSNAPTVCSLRGPFNNFSIAGAAGPSISVDGFLGLDSNNSNNRTPIVGGGVTLGGGTGAASSTSATGTRVVGCQ